MKTVKTNENVIRRLPDEIARNVVASGKATFVPKSEWKALRPTVTAPAPSAAPRKKVSKTRSRRADFKARGNRSSSSKKGR